MFIQKFKSWQKILAYKAMWTILSFFLKNYVSTEEKMFFLLLMYIYGSEIISYFFVRMSFYKPQVILIEKIKLLIFW